jgi:hypothetical protein
MIQGLKTSPIDSETDDSGPGLVSGSTSFGSGKMKKAMLRIR